LRWVSAEVSGCPSFLHAFPAVDNASVSISARDPLTCDLHTRRRRVTSRDLTIGCARPASDRVRSRVGACLSAVLSLLAFWPAGLRASNDPAQPGIHRPARAIPQKLVISPSGITLAASQTQRFAVTDADGRSVAVRWNVSGLRCAGSACGTISVDGTFRAPHALTKTLQVVLEGVVVSDPKHSVLTHIQLAPAGNSTTAPVVADSDDPGTVTKSLQAGLPAASTSAEISAKHIAANRGFTKPVSITPGPLVAYQGGQLTIDAENTTLAAVLAVVAEKTGAVIDVPEGSAQDPIVEHVGPGPANDVLRQLLNGSGFNFVIVSSPQYPDEPKQVLLTLKPEQPAATKTVAVAPPVPAVAPPLETVEDAPEAIVAPPPVMAPPKEQMTPDEIQQAMKDKARELREAQQNAQPH